MMQAFFGCGDGRSPEVSDPLARFLGRAPRCLAREADLSVIHEDFLGAEPDTPLTLARAVAEGRIQRVCEILERRPGLALWCGFRGDSLLAEAVADNNETMVLLLLLRGAEPDVMGARGQGSAEYEAQVFSRRALVPLLESRGGFTLLHRAAATADAREIGTVLVLDRLRRRIDGTGDALVDARDRLGRTPLHVAAALGSLATIDALLRAGSDIEAIDHRRQAPLHLAASGGHAGAVLALLAAGASPLALDGLSRTPLHYAAQSGSVTTIDALLGAVSADVRPARSDADGRTPVHALAWRGASDALHRLVDVGFACDEPDAFGLRPLHLAAAAGNAPLVQALLACGADADARDGLGRTPLNLLAGATPMVAEPGLRAWGSEWRASWNCAPDLAPGSGAEADRALDLLRVSDGTNGPCESPPSAMNIVAAAGLLLRAGAHVDVPDRRGRTALHEAARAFRPELVVGLLESGASPKRADVCGRTPLHDGAAAGSTQIVLALLQQGADPGARDGCGRTACDEADARSLGPVVDLLEAAEVDGGGHK